MCGIAGLIRFNSLGVGADGPGEDACVRARGMRAALRHRGPDGEGEAVFADGVVVHTRLSLLDRAGGAQPMTSADGRYVLVFNGEIYNHLELRGRLSHAFRTRSDAETLLAAFLAWGPGCVQFLNGMFAFFVWDTVARRGFLARDPLGVKPLAYAWDGEEFVFASEAGVVARARRSRVRACEEAVLEVLVAPCFSGVERSMFAGVEYLQPGCWAEVGPGGPVVRRYFNYEVARDGAPDDESLRAAFKIAVRRTCVADERVGVFLSGGLDSSAVAVVAASAEPRVEEALTIGFEGMDGYDYGRSTIVVSNDLEFVGLAADAAGVRCTRVEVARGDLAADLERISTTNDALPAWEQEVAQDRLARAAAAAGMKAVLVGDAADETHFGYHFLLDAAATADPSVIIKRFGGVAVRREVMADPVAVFADRYRAWMRPGTEREDQVADTTRLIVERWLPRLLHNGDIHTMRSGVEARVPFADVDLLALAMAVSPRAGLAEGEKTRLRAALRGVVPEAIRTRRKSALPKDQGAEAVYRREAVRLLAEPPELVRALVDLEAVAATLASARALDERERAGLFRVIGLCHFARHHGFA